MVYVHKYVYQILFLEGVALPPPLSYTYHRVEVRSAIVWTVDDVDACHGRGDDHRRRRVEVVARRLANVRSQCHGRTESGDGFVRVVTQPTLERAVPLDDHRRTTAA